MFWKFIKKNTIIMSTSVSSDTSKKFQNYMVETAKKLQKRIVLPEGEDKRILSAAAKLTEDGLGLPYHSWGTKPSACPRRRIRP